MVGLAPRAPGDIVRPCRLSGLVVRPLNFTVRSPSRMNAALKGLTASVLWCALSCALASPDARISENEGVVDVNLPIVAVSKNEGLVRVIAHGVIDGAEVGFEVDLLPKGTAQVRSIGAPSDHFINLLAQHYKLPPPGSKMVPYLDASVVILGRDSGRSEMKFFFFADGPEERYAEVYINIDITKQVLEFHEKDEDYRKPLLLDLTKGS